MPNATACTSCPASMCATDTLCCADLVYNDDSLSLNGMECHTSDNCADLSTCDVPSTGYYLKAGVTVCGTHWWRWFFYIGRFLFYVLLVVVCVVGVIAVILCICYVVATCHGYWYGERGDDLQESLSSEQVSSCKTATVTDFALLKNKKSEDDS